MGRRYLSEEIPGQVQYKPATEIADQMRSFGAEEFERGENVRKEHAENQSRIRQQDVDNSNQIAQGVTQGINSGVEAYDKSQQRARQDREEKRQNMVAEEQMAGSKQQRQQSAALHPGAIKAQETAIAGQETQNKLAATQAKEAQATADIGDAEAKGVEGALPPEPGETQRQYNARLAVVSNSFNLEAQKAQVAQAQQSLENAKWELANNKNLAPLQKQQLAANIKAQDAQVASLNMTLKEQQRAVNIRGAKAEIMNALNNGGDLKTVREKLGKSVSDQEFAEGIAEANTGRLNSQLLQRSIQNMDPEYQANIMSRVKGIQDFRIYKSALGDLQNAEARYKLSSNLPDEEGKAALDQYVAALENVGEDEFARNIRDKVDLSNLFKGEAPTREARMEKITGIVKARLASKMHELKDLDPKFQQYGNALVNSQYTPPAASAYIGQLVPQTQPGTGGRLVELTGMPGVTITMPAAKVTSK
jgi:hypothetical protein